MRGYCLFVVSNLNSGLMRCGQRGDGGRASSSGSSSLVPLENCSCRLVGFSSRQKNLAISRSLPSKVLSSLASGKLTPLLPWRLARCCGGVFYCDDGSIICPTYPTRPLRPRSHPQPTNQQHDNERQQRASRRSNDIVVVVLVEGGLRTKLMAGVVAYTCLSLLGPVL